MDMRNLLNKLSGMLAENEAGPVKQCVSCGDKAHVDSTTGMCVDCQTKAEQEQGLSESPMGRRAPSESHTCHTCGRPMPNWQPGDSHECDECESDMTPDDSNPDELDELDESDLTEVTALGDRNPGRVEPDDPALRDDSHEQTVEIPTEKCLELVAKEFEGDEGYAWDEFEQLMQREVPGWKTSDWDWDVQVTDSGIKVFTQEKEYSGDDYSLDEGAMCEDCGASPCVCESEQLDEVTPPGFKKKHPGLMKKLKKQYPGEKDKAYATAWKISKTDESGSAELDRMKQMMECWGPMAAPQTSGMNVTTNVDSKTGNKTVTVTADGAGAEDLMKILSMAGIAVAPSPVSNVAVGEQLANEPAPSTLDARTQLVDMSGGPNAPHGQYNPDRGRDNSMTMVDESVNRLARQLKIRFEQGR